MIGRRKILIAGAAALSVAPLSRALAQAARKVPVVGYVSAAFPSFTGSPAKRPL